MVRKIIIKLTSTIAALLPVSLKQALYQFGPLARLIRDSLNRAAPEGMTKITVAAGELKGCQLLLDLQSEKDYWLGTYETELQSAVREFVKSGWVAYDLGANIGYVSLMLAKNVGQGGKVFSFEALPENVSRLRENMTLNSMAARVQVIHGAVGASSTPVRFFVGPSGAMGKIEGAAGRSELHSKSIEVQGFSLDDFVFEQSNPPPQIIKMDIEGGEILALPGMQKVLEKFSPLIFLELHGPEAAQVAWDTLSGLGYRISLMQSGYPVVSTIDEHDWKAYLVALP